MHQQPPDAARIAAEVVSARQLSWITLVAASMLGAPLGPPGSLAEVYRLLAAVIWLGLVVVLNV